MGLLDRFKKVDVDVEPAAPVELDERARTTQLLVLADALDDLAAGMRADAGQRFNPGWAGRMDEYVTAAGRARDLRRDGFDLESLHDLAAEVRPLFVRGQGLAPGPEMEALEPLQERVMEAVTALRTVLPQERPSG